MNWIKALFTLFILVTSYTYGQEVNDYKISQEKGRNFIIQSKYDSAIYHFDKALSIMEYSSSMYYERGYAKMELEDYRGAQADFTKVIELAPHKYYAYSNRAIIFMHLEKPYKAKADVDKALELNPENKQSLSIKNDIYETIALIEAKKLAEYEALAKKEAAARQNRRSENSRALLGTVIPLAFWTTLFLTW